MSPRRHRRSPEVGEFVLELVLKLLATFILGSLIIGGYAMAQSHIEYWLAYLIAFVIVFGGVLIIKHSDDLDF